MTNKQKRHMILMGIRFGYQSCCIGAFVTTPLASDRDWPNPWENTGYVPCRVCANEPMLTVQGRINSHRDPKLPPFPSDKV